MSNGIMQLTCHLAEVSFSPLPQPITVGAPFSIPIGMEGWVDLVNCLHTEVVYPPKDSQPSQY